MRLTSTCRPPSSPLRPDRGRMQHEFGHSRLPRRRGPMEAPAAGDFSGFHGRGQDAPALLGAQSHRLAAHKSGQAERRAPRFGPARAKRQIEVILTQNVDRLHQAAGSARVIDLHGRIDLVRCMNCGRRSPRDEFQDELGQLNAGWLDLDASPGPGRRRRPGTSGLFFLRHAALPGLRRRAQAGRRVFRRERSPRADRSASRHLDEADAMLIVGSSLMVFSGFRFAQQAAASGKPLAAVNLGRTRADGLLALKTEQACEGPRFPVVTAGPRKRRSELECKPARVVTGPRRPGERMPDAPDLCRDCPHLPCRRRRRAAAGAWPRGHSPLFGLRDHGPAQDELTATPDPSLKSDAILHRLGVRCAGHEAPVRARY